MKLLGLQGFGSFFNSVEEVLFCIVACVVLLSAGSVAADFDVYELFHMCEFEGEGLKIKIRIGADSRIHITYLS